MNRPVKLGKKNAAPEPPIQKPGAKPKPATSRNPPKELNTCSLLPSTRSRVVPRKGCSGSLPLGSSSSSSGDSCNSSFSRSRPLPRNNPSDSSKLRSGAPLLPRNPAPGTRLGGSLRQVGASKPQKPRAADHLQRRNSSKVGSDGSFQKKQKNAEARGGHGRAVMAKHQRPPAGKELGGVDASARGSNQEYYSAASIPGSRVPLPPPRVRDVDPKKMGVVIPVGKISNNGSMTPNKDVEHQRQQLYSHTPRSTGTATPPVQASVSPEIPGGQSTMPTHACFAAGHLLTGVHDRRKCRPRGILNGGDAGGMETKERRSFRSLADDGDRCGASWTPPPMVEASMHWLSSPSSASRVPLKDRPGEASVSWLLSPSQCENFPASSSTFASNGASLPSKVFLRASSDPDATVGNSPVFKAFDVGFTSPQHKDTRTVLGICCSPSADGSISPYSMILKRAGANWESCRDLSPEEDKERCCYGSLMGEISPLPQSNGCGGVTQTLTSGGSKSYLPLSALSFQFSYASTPSPNSVDLACFRRTLCHQSSVREDYLSVGEEKLSYSDLRVSWRGGLISRIFEMDELDLPGSKLDLKFHQNSRDSMPTAINEMDATKLANGLGSVDLVGDAKSGQQCRAEGAVGSLFSCAESLSMEGDGLEASVDSDWSLFYKNNLFQV